MTKAVLVLNAGSSSLKYALYNFGERAKLAVVGLVEYIGSSKSSITHKVLDGGEKQSLTENIPAEDHRAALQKVVDLLRFDGAQSKGIFGVGHRVVHGGEALTEPALITESVKQSILRATPLAPLHNPANLQGIQVAEQIFDCPQVAVFDTAFHATIPPHAYMYALPYNLYKDLGVRRYGFHGTSYTYLLAETSKLLGRQPTDLNLIMLHLGAGASMAAIKGGKCIDTTMGVTPLEGLVMATRSGDVDAAIVKLLADERQMSPSQVDDLLNKKSGLLGLCGEKDMRTVVEKSQEGDTLARLALEVFVHRIRKYLGAYMVHLGGRVDAIVFSAGIGERSAPVRSLICQGLEEFGIVMDEHRNFAEGKGDREIQAESSAIKILIVPTDEELCIAQQTLQVIHTSQKATC